MVTIILEVVSNLPNRVYHSFYNPSPAEFRKYPRTEKGIQKAIKEMVKTVNKYDWISEYRFKIFEGKVESYKKVEPQYIIDSLGNVV